MRLLKEPGPQSCRSRGTNGCIGDTLSRLRAWNRSDCGLHARKKSRTISSRKKLGGEKCRHGHHDAAPSEDSSLVFLSEKLRERAIFALVDLDRCKLGSFSQHANDFSPCYEKEAKTTVVRQGRLRCSRHNTSSTFASEDSGQRVIQSEALIELASVLGTILKAHARSSVMQLPSTLQDDVVLSLPVSVEESDPPVLEHYYDKVADLKDMEEELNAYVRSHIDTLHRRELLKDQGEEPTPSDEEFAEQYHHRRRQYEHQLQSLEIEIKAIKEQCQQEGLEIKIYRDGIEQPLARDSVPLGMQTTYLGDEAEAVLADLDNIVHDVGLSDGLGVEHITWDRIMNVTPPRSRSTSHAGALQDWLDTTSEAV